MNGANMVRVGYAQNNSFRQRPPMYVATSVSDLTGREEEIVNKIRNMLSPLGVPLKFDLGRQSECSPGLSLSVTAFIGDTSGNPAPFVLSRQMLAAMAEDREKYNEIMQRIEKQIEQRTSNQLWQSNQQDDTEKTLTQKAAERRSHQIKVNMISVLDFWNENREEGRSWTQPTQGQALQQMVSKFEQFLG